MKKKEGAELARDLNSRIEKINKKVLGIEKIFRKSINEYYKKLLADFTELSHVTIEVNVCTDESCTIAEHE